MLRKVVLCTAVLALTLAAPRAHAGSIMLSLFGGGHVPSGDYKDATKTGFLAGVGGDYAVNDMWAVGVDASFNRAKNKIDGDPGIGGAEIKSTNSIIQGGPHVRYLIPTQGQIVPFIEAGGGAYHIKSKTENLSATDLESSSTKAGGHGGVGFNFKATPSLMIGAAGNLHFVKTKDDKVVGSKNSQYYDVHAGVTFNLGSGAGS